MKSSSPATTLLLVALILLPPAYALYVYPSLPDQVAVHFDLAGTPDRYGSKDNVWILALVMSVVAAGIYLLMLYLPKIDPKKTAGQSPELFRKIGLLVAAFLCAISLILIYAMQNGGMNATKLMFPLMGLLFLVLGNYMHSIKPNYFVGVRLPWTLENEDNWRRTHQLTGKIWVPGGLLITITSLLLPPKPAFIVFLVLIATMVLVPTIFSYRYFKKHQSHNA